MADNINYQQSRRIRKTNFTDLLSDQLLYNKSITGAIGKTISLKTQAKIKGIKEKFDPLNIARALTFGSKLGPALYGRLAGRSIKDIEYFTGRMRPIHTGGKGRLDKLRPGEATVSGGEVSGEGLVLKEVNKQLIRIYGDLKKNNENMVKRIEREKNFDEERQLESLQRHKELLKALGGISGGPTIAGKSPSGKGFLETLFDMFNSLSTFLAPLINMMKSGLTSVFSTLLKFAATPAGLAAGLIFAGAFAVEEIARQMLRGDREARDAAKRGDLEATKKATGVFMTNEAEANGVNTTDLAKSYLKNAGTPEAAATLKKIEEEEQKRFGYKEHYITYMSQKGYYPHGRNNDIFKNFKGEMAPKKIMDEADAYAKSKMPAPPAVKPQPAPVPSKPESSSGSAPAALPSPPSTGTPPPSTPTSSVGQTLSNAIAENTSLGLDSTVKVAQKDAQLNSSVNVNTSSGRDTPMPGVRNSEDTLQRLIYNSTRVV